ncbi:MAG: hypothetical protein ACPG4Y_05210 [Chitinophagales bacterium]
MKHSINIAINKKSILLIIALLTIVSVRATSTPSMYIQGNSIGIHQHSSLATIGNVYLQNTHIAGNGSLILIATKQQHIISANSSINHLIVANPTQVVVVGVLVLNNTLHIQKGIFNTQNAQLSLLPGIHVHTAPNAYWLQNLNQNKTPPHSILNLVAASYNNSLNYIAPPNNILPHTLISTTAYTSSIQNMQSLCNTEVIKPPPKA